MSSPFEKEAKTKTPHSWVSHHTIINQIISTQQDLHYSVRPHLSPLRQLGSCNTRVFSGECTTSLCVYLFLLHLCSLQAVNVGSELDNLAQQVRRLALPIPHRFRVVGVAGRELRGRQ